MRKLSKGNDDLIHKLNINIKSEKSVKKFISSLSKHMDNLGDGVCLSLLFDIIENTRDDFGKSILNEFEYILAEEKDITYRILLDILFCMNKSAVKLSNKNFVPLKRIITDAYESMVFGSGSWYKSLTEKEAIDIIDDVNTSLMTNIKAMANSDFYLTSSSEVAEIEGNIIKQTVGLSVFRHKYDITKEYEYRINKSNLRGNKFSILSIIEDRMSAIIDELSDSIETFMVMMEYNEYEELEASTIDWDMDFIEGMLNELINDLYAVQSSDEQEADIEELYEGSKDALKKFNKSVIKAVRLSIPDIDTCSYKTSIMDEVYLILINIVLGFISSLAVATLTNVDKIEDKATQIYILRLILCQVSITGNNIFTTGTYSYIPLPKINKQEIELGWGDHIEELE